MRKNEGTRFLGALSVIVLSLVWVTPQARAARPLPTIEYYRAAATTIYKVQAVGLSWKVSGASRVDVWDGFRQTTYPNLQHEGYIEVWPESTADYVLYAYNADNQYATSKLTINVVKVDP